MLFNIKAKIMGRDINEPLIRYNEIEEEYELVSPNYDAYRYNKPVKVLTVKQRIIRAINRFRGNVNEDEFFPML